MELRDLTGACVKQHLFSRAPFQRRGLPVCTVKPRAGHFLPTIGRFDPCPVKPGSPSQRESLSCVCGGYRARPIQGAGGGDWLHFSSAPVARIRHLCAVPSGAHGSAKQLCFVAGKPNFHFEGVLTVAKGKRTFQPNNRRRARVHGFRTRMRTRAGRAIVSARRRKGRKSLTA